MKSKQILSIEQMQRLQELGLELKETMMRWQMANPKGQWMLVPTSFQNKKVIGIPAYTLQDMLDALPKMIYPFPVHKIGFELWIGSGKIFYANMFNLEDVLKVRYDKELIDAAYELLVWCIENGYVETNKNE